MVTLRTYKRGKILYKILPNMKATASTISEVVALTLPLLYAIINRKEVHNASGKHKEVPYTVHPFYFFHRIKNTADGIEYAA